MAYHDGSALRCADHRGLAPRYDPCPGVFAGAHVATSAFALGRSRRCRLTLPASRARRGGLFAHPGPSGDDPTGARGVSCRRETATLAASSVAPEHPRSTPQTPAGGTPGAVAGGWRPPVSTPASQLESADQAFLLFPDQPAIPKVPSRGDLSGVPMERARRVPVEGMAILCPLACLCYGQCRPRRRVNLDGHCRRRAPTVFGAHAPT